MIQVFATIFFSAAILSASGVIAAMIGDNLADVRRALGLVGEPALPSPHASMRRVVRVRSVSPRAAARLPLRAAA